MLNIIGLLGLYGVISDLICDGFHNCALPINQQYSRYIAYTMMYGLPISCIFMLLQKKQLYKIIGYIYLIGCGGSFYLFCEALV
jgi:hypothetical protein